MVNESDSKPINIESTLAYLMDNLKSIDSESIFKMIPYDIIEKITIISQNSSVPTSTRFLLKDLLELIETHLEYDESPPIILTEIRNYVIKNNDNNLKIIVLVGAPTIGKSVIGQTLEKEGHVMHYADIGKRLANRGETERYFRSPTKSREEYLNEQARLLLADSIQTYINKQSEHSTTLTTTVLPMIVTFIKTGNDVFHFFDIVSKVMNRNNISENNYKIDVIYLHEDLEKVISIICLVI
jgi:uncharacterized protein YjgD (DUF1641 family)